MWPSLHSPSACSHLHPRSLRTSSSARSRTHRQQRRRAAASRCPRLRGIKASRPRPRRRPSTTCQPTRFSILPARSATSSSVPLRAAAGTNENSAVTITVTVPANQPIGTYYLLACADHDFVITEPAGETNNCRASITQVLITRPDPSLTPSRTRQLRRSGKQLRGHGHHAEPGPRDCRRIDRRVSSVVRCGLQSSGPAFGDWRLTGSRAVPALNSGATSMER
jgi:hypothetical protein